MKRINYASDSVESITKEVIEKGLTPICIGFKNATGIEDLKQISDKYADSTNTDIGIGEYLITDPSKKLISIDMLVYTDDYKLIIGAVQMAASSAAKLIETDDGYTKDCDCIIIQTPDFMKEKDCLEAACIVSSMFKASVMIAEGDSSECHKDKSKKKKKDKKKDKKKGSTTVVF